MIREKIVVTNLFYKKAEPFILYALSDLIANKRALRLILSPTINSSSDPTVKGIECNGFYCGKGKEFGMAMKKPVKEWFSVFVHEYCHFLQHREKFKPFMKMEITDKNFPNWDLWLAGEREYGEEKLKYAFKTIQDVEWDCERRVLELIDKHSLPIDPLHYAREANSYVMFYSVALRLRRWYVKEPYKIKAICDRLSTKLYTLEEMYNPPVWFIEEIQKYCF